MLAKILKREFVPPIIPQNEKFGAARFLFLREIVQRYVLTKQRGIPSSHTEQNGGAVMRPIMAVVCSFLRALRSMNSLFTTINLTGVLQLKCGACFTLLFVLFLDCLTWRKPYVEQVTYGKALVN